MYLGLIKPTIVNANCIQIVFKLFFSMSNCNYFFPSLINLYFIVTFHHILKMHMPYSMNNWLYVCVFYPNIHTSDIFSSKNMICWYFELLIHSNTMPLNYVWYVKYQNLYITILINWPNTFLLWSKAQF